MKEFTQKRYATGRYNVVTRDGHPVEILEVRPDAVKASIPTKIDCRGHHVYGYLYDGKRGYSTDSIDLMLQRKPTWFSNLIKKILACLK